jgi:hypothetical protein
MQGEHIALQVRRKIQITGLPGRGAAGKRGTAIRLGGSYILRLRTLGTLGDPHGNFLTLGQGLASTAVDGTVMNECILAVFLRNKTKSFLIVEPLDGSGNLT